MWLSIKHWRDWAMNNLWPLPRTGPQPQTLHFSFEKAGITLHDQPIPWNAEAVLVEAVVQRLPTGAARRRADFQLRVDRETIYPAETMRREEGTDRHRLFFRLAVPPRTVNAELLWRNHALGQVLLPVQHRDDFVSHLRLQMPTLFVRLADQTVACQTFVSTQCRGLYLSALLSSPTGLVPLLDLDLRVELRSERTNNIQNLPVRLCSSQLAGRQALLTLVPPKFPRRIGVWTATWIVGERVLAVQQIRAISQRHFLQSLRISDTRFILQSDKEGVLLTRHVPPLEKGTRLGPCFLISSREPGMAGTCPLQVRAQIPGGVQAPLLGEEEVLITDGPTVFAPGTLDGSDLQQVSAFELRLKNVLLGAMPLCPAPTAAFTPEGGFKAPQEFNWTSAAEEELAERLGKLFDGAGE